MLIGFTWSIPPMISVELPTHNECQLRTLAEQSHNCSDEEFFKEVWPELQFLTGGNSHLLRNASSYANDAIQTVQKARLIVVARGSASAVGCRDFCWRWYSSRENCRANGWAVRTGGKSQS
jgi:hypothetical protein